MVRSVWSYEACQIYTYKLLDVTGSAICEEPTSIAQQLCPPHLGCRPVSETNDSRRSRFFEGDPEVPPPTERLALEHDYDSVIAAIEEDVDNAYDDQITLALASAKKNSETLWTRFVGELSNIDGLPYNEYKELIAKHEDELVSQEEQNEEQALEESTPNDPPEPEGDAEPWPSVAEMVKELFDTRSQHLADAYMTVFIRMLFVGVSDCPMVIAVGQASTGKSTVAELFNGLHLSQSHDIVTSSAWISHNADGQKGEYDLLPRIKQRVMVAAEMGPWFTGDDVGNYMRVLSRVADGSGMSKTTGAHGTTRYEADYPGEYRFGLVGATTFPNERAWIEMGNAGSRFLFHPMPKVDDLTQLMHTLNDGKYTEKKAQAREAITGWWNYFYHKHSGEITDDEMPTLSEDQQRALMLMARIISRGRAVDFGGDHDQSGVDMSEQESRSYKMLERMVCARALGYERAAVNDADMQMAARVAFASIPQWRQPMVKMLCNPAHDGHYKSRDVEQRLEVARSTALNRMKEAGRIGIGCYEEEPSENGQTTAVVSLEDIRLQGIFEKETVPWPFSSGE